MRGESKQSSIIKEKNAQQFKCALHICRNLFIRHQTTLEFPSRILARLTSPVAQRFQQLPPALTAPNCLTEKHFGVTMQESELVTDVHDTRKILVGAGCLVP